MAKVAVVGAGGVGSLAAYIISQEGHQVILVDKSPEAASRAAQKYKLQYVVADALSPQDVKKAVGDVDLLVTALPGGVAFRALKGLIGLGANIVDVSFFPEDPDELAKEAEKAGITLVVDAGVAPGLSNMLVGVGDRKLGGIRGAYIYVGGISERPDPPLGLVPTWSISDLIDEYRRPARAIVSGKLVKYDPLSGPFGTIYVPGVGELEYFPTDGLRSLLKTYSNVEFLAEYTLRWPGHVNFVKGLKRLGLLDHKPIRIGGYEIMADELLANLIWYMKINLSDIVVLIVDVYSKSGGGIRFTQVTRAEGGVSAMARVTGSVLAYTALTLLEGKVKGPGIVYPEQIGLNEDAAGRILTLLSANGMPVYEEPLPQPSS